MKMAVFISDYRSTVDTFDRLKYEKLGVIFVENGVYHAALKENGNSSPILKKSADFYVLSEDLETRGLSNADVDGAVKVITYGELVDLIFNDYEKLAWL
jgi:sulfur relay protein TusB/DsrH